MSSGFSDLDQWMSRDEIAAPRCFYTSPRIQEILTAAKYGVEARKGLTIITGAPGVGKSTLLRKVAAELPANVSCVFVSDPRVSFSDITRLILRKFNFDQSYEDDAALIRTCTLQLRARLDEGQIVALFLDNAQQFPDRTLHSIAENFLTRSVSNSDGTLLQVVLAGRGRTPLRGKLLTAFHGRAPIVYELQSLDSGEVAAFIETSFKTCNGLSGTFDERVIKRIALYANGNPLAINSICERALQLAGNSADANLTPELIESAAGDLHLRQFPRQDRLELETPEPLETPKQFEKFANNDLDPHEFTAPREFFSEPIFPQDTAEADGEKWQSRKGRTTAWARRLIILLILAGSAGALVRTDSALSVVSGWRATLSQTVARYLQSAPRVKIGAENSPETLAKGEPLVPLPGPDHPAEIHEDTLPPSAGNSDPPAAAPPENLVAGSSVKTAPTIAAPPVQEPQSSNKPHPGHQNETLQSQITKAIEDRAIMGVEVSVIQGTAYLDGHVASERQRRAAERAARSVAGVERVRNRIAITYG